jgi:hypothetical protein
MGAIGALEDALKVSKLVAEGKTAEKIASSAKVAEDATKIGVKAGADFSTVFKTAPLFGDLSKGVPDTAVNTLMANWQAGSGQISRMLRGIQPDRLKDYPLVLTNALGTSSRTTGEEVVKVADAMTSKPLTEPNRILYRGFNVPKSVADGFVKDGSIQPPEYLAFSKNQFTAKKFAQGELKSVILELRNTKGVHGVDLSATKFGQTPLGKQEEEVILARNQKYRIVSVDELQNGAKHVVIEPYDTKEGSMVKVTRPDSVSNGHTDSVHLEVPLKNGRTTLRRPSEIGVSTISRQPTNVLEAVQATPEETLRNKLGSHVDFEKFQQRVQNELESLMK